MKNAYLNLTHKIYSLPVLDNGGNTRLTKTVAKLFSNDMKEYWVSGNARIVSDFENIQARLVEEYFGKCKDGKYFEELPFFKKITETKPTYGDRGLVITRANGKGLSTKTTVNSEGIRQYKVEQRLSKDRTYYDCARYLYNENGTKPAVFSTWVKPVG